MTLIIQHLVDSLVSISTFTGVAGYVVKSTLLMALLLLLQPLLRAASPAVRHLTLRIGLAGVLLLTLLVFVMPTWLVPYPDFVGNHSRHTDERSKRCSCCLFHYPTLVV